MWWSQIKGIGKQIGPDSKPKMPQSCWWCIITLLTLWKKVPPALISETLEWHKKHILSDKYSASSYCAKAVTLGGLHEMRGNWVSTKRAYQKLWCRHIRRSDWPHSTPDAIFFFFCSRWGILFSHPKDYTPVCTTELGRAARLSAEFSKRNVKMIALSIDCVEDHHGWTKVWQLHHLFFWHHIWTHTLGALYASI